MIKFYYFSYIFNLFNERLFVFHTNLLYQTMKFFKPSDSVLQRKQF